MKIIGNKDIFAFQYEISDHIGNHIYGHLAVWINKQLIGDYLGYSTLSISVSFLQDFLKEYPQRNYHNSEFKGHNQIFFELYDFFYEKKSLENNNYLLGKYREIFWLDEVGEYSFRDKLGMILVNEPKRQRLIWKQFSTGTIQEYFLPFDYFDETAKLFLKDFKRSL